MDFAVQWHDTCLTDLFIHSISLEIAAKKFYLLFVSLPPPIPIFLTKHVEQAVDGWMVFGIKGTRIR